MPTAESSHENPPAGLPLAVDVFDRLSPNQQRLARFVTENPSIAAFASASEIARSVDMSTATVVRFAQTLGYSGFPHFQEVVRGAYLGTLKPLESLNDLSSARRDVFDSQLHQDIDNLRRTSHMLMVDRSATIELGKRILRSQAILVAATGAAAAMAVLFGHYLRLFGLRVATELRSGSELIDSMAPLGAEDCLVVFEFGRTAGGLARALSWASTRGVFTAAVTDSAYSATARVADLTLVQITEGVAGIPSLVGPLSVVQAIIGNLIESASPDAKKRFSDALEGVSTLSE